MKRQWENNVMRRLTLITIGVIILLAILIPQFIFVVDETKVAIVTRFGNIESEIDSPGPYIKMPFIDTVTQYEKRLLIQAIKKMQNF